MLIALTLTASFALACMGWQSALIEIVRLARGAEFDPEKHAAWTCYMFFPNLFLFVSLVG